jgi:hypothetical protein
MAKSPKSRYCKGRCCKVDAVKVKGLLGGGEDHVWFEDRWMVASLCDE